MTITLAEINQLELFSAVEQAYEHTETGQLVQNELYELVAQKLKINPSEHYAEVGGQNINLFYRKVRWVQQSLKEGRLLENVSRGVWKLAGKAKEKIQLKIIEPGHSILAMSTNLGVVICSEAQTVLEQDVIPDKEISLVVTSPPYLLQSQRKYDGPTEQRAWVDFIMSVMEPLKRKIVDGGSLFINIGNDSFHSGKPARTTHLERFVLAMEDCGYWLVDRLILRSNKVPGPYAWTSLHRVMMKSAYEFCFHFTTDPSKLFTNNQEILLPHTESYRKFVTRGGTLKSSPGSSDGAHSKTAGDYSKTDLSKGRLPDNAPFFANKCTHNELVNRFARENNLPTHGAKMPFRIAEWLIKYASRVGDVVFDPFYGSGTTCEAAEALGRNWIGCEPVFQYLQQSFVRFKTYTDEIWINPLFQRKLNLNGQYV